MISALASIPFSPSYLEHHGVLPLSNDDGMVVIGHWREAVDVAVIDDMRLAFRAEPDLVPIAESEALSIIRRMHARQHERADSESDAADLVGVTTLSPDGSAEGDLLTLANEAPVVRLVNLLLMDAVEARASDVHLEQSETGIAARFRVDGILQDVASPPARLAAAVISRIKVMAELDVAERRQPQDGRIRLRVHDRAIDIRVSTVPVLHGESVVLRLLDRTQSHISLKDLGLHADDEVQLRSVIRRPQRIVLTTGPTGSGKTTTLYAALSEIRSGREKIITLEDPVEYELPGVAQVPVSPRVPFATALRSLLRQDPDVLLIGEIRDRETAEIAIHAALTGHLVFSTLHTNDSLGAIARLVDMGIPSFLIAATLEAVVAQRLVRRVCEACAIQQAVTVEEARALGVASTAGFAERRGSGCERCRSTGYLGRTALYELLVVDGALRSAIEQNAPASQLQRLAARAGMRTLRERGVLAVEAGVTTAAEVVRLLGTAAA